MPRKQLADAAWRIGDVDMTDIEIMAYLVSEMRRRRRDNRLSDLSSGAPCVARRD